MQMGDYLHVLLAVQDLTNENVKPAGAGGELEDSDNLTFDGSTLTVTGDLDPTNVSIGNTLQALVLRRFYGISVAGIATLGSDVVFSFECKYHL